jgi:phosphoribosylglycinamide formyltransferase-1
MKKILLFASGTGSNVENILKYFKNNNEIRVVSVFSNNPKANVLSIAAKHAVPTYIFDKDELTGGAVLDKLKEFQPDLIVLAGFLWKMPEDIVHQYTDKIINIHPALLPKYGGKGMYGMKVHEIILANRELETGITIHYVNEHYDEGAYILQQTVSIEDCDTPDEIAAKVHALEHMYFPQVIAKLLNSKP